MLQDTARSTAMMAVVLIFNQFNKTAIAIKDTAAAEQLSAICL